jgi:two-component system phosphate regulon sensor histidine kinase PhoR
LFAFISDKNLEKYFIGDLDISLINQAKLVASQVPYKYIMQSDMVSLEALVKDLSTKINARVTVIDTKGSVLADSEKSLDQVPLMDNHANRPEIRSALGGSVGEKTRYSKTLRIDMLYVAIPIKNKNDIIGVARLALPLIAVANKLDSIRKVIIISVMLAIFVSLIFSLILTTGITKLIKKIINVSKSFSAGNFNRKIYHNSNDEIGELADTLNKMAQNIEEKIKDINIQSQQLKAVFDSMIEGVIVVDKTKRIISVNKAIENIFSIAKDNVQGRVFLEVIHNNDIGEILDLTLEEGRGVSREIILLYPIQRVFEVNASPIFENNSVSGCLIVIHDITGIRRLETIRKDFVANVSHELKTPLTSIKGFVETLLSGALEDKENNRKFLEIIQAHADRLDRLVNDLLSLSHLESKEMAIDKSEFNFNDEVNKVIAGFKAQIKNKQIELINQLPDGMLINADRNRVEQVLVNLIDNAIKFNKEKGNIKIYGEYLNESLKVTIEDSGIGIPEKDVPRIFERFYRADKARSRELGGTGLGLSIVKHIIDLHRGSIRVESIEGLGSKFIFTLPR